MQLITMIKFTTNCSRILMPETFLGLTFLLVILTKVSAASDLVWTTFFLNYVPRGWFTVNPTFECFCWTGNTKRNFLYTFLIIQLFNSHLLNYFLFFYLNFFGKEIIYVVEFHDVLRGGCKSRFAIPILNFYYIFLFHSYCLSGFQRPHETGNAYQHNCNMEKRAYGINFREM